MTALDLFDLSNRVVVITGGAGLLGDRHGDAIASAGGVPVVVDIDSDRAEARAKAHADKYGVEAVSPDQIVFTDCDILAPCALGAVINDQTIGKLKCKVVCGGANNQLAEPRHGDQLREMGILYAPDFVVNAGGIINVFYELDGYNRDRAMAHAEKIYDTTWNIFQTAKAENIPTYKAANLLAEKRIEAIARINAVL